MNFRQIKILALALVSAFIIWAPLTRSLNQTISVPGGADLQAAVDSAAPGSILALADGAEFTGNFVVAKSLTLQGKATIRTPNSGPAINIPPKTGPVTLRGLEVTTASGQVFDIVRYGSQGADQDSMDEVPQGLTIDDCDIHGQPGQEVQRGVSANGANVIVTNSKIREVHGKGYDTQALCAWNGPGPFKILDSYLEASGENIMFGGALPSIPNLIPAGIEIRRSQFFKPLAWRGVWTVKNLLEFKNARDIVVDSNTFENSWTDAQVGYGILFTVRGEDGRAPWATVQNVTFSNNVVKNTDQGIQTLGSDNAGASVRGDGLRIVNNQFIGVRNWFFVLNGFNNVLIEHNTHFQGGSLLVMTGDKSLGFIYRNNVTVREPEGFGIFGDAIGEGTRALDAFTPDYTVAGNVIAGAQAFLYPASNFFPSDLSGLAALKGTDGQTPGFRSGATPTPTPTPSPSPTPTPTPTPTPSPRQYEAGRWVWPTTVTAQDALIQQRASEGWSSCLVDKAILRCLRARQ